MSTATPQRRFHPSVSTSGYLDPTKLDPESIFDHVLWENPEVCNGCFARIRDFELHSDESTSANRLGTGNRPTETCIRARDGVMGQDTNQHDEYGSLRTYFGRTYCGECGSPSGRATDETLAKQAAIDRIPAILARFREEWLAIDPDTVYTVVRRGKSVPKWKDQDTEIFRAAVKLAVKRARGIES